MEEEVAVVSPAESIIFDFDVVVERRGTGAEKYEALERLFGDTEADPFWVADMDLASPGFLVDALRERLSHPIFGYTETDTAVYSAIEWWMKSEHGLSVKREWISLSPSVVTSISMAVQALSAPGDAVVLLSPVYGPFFNAIRDNGRRVVDHPMVVERGRYEVDFEALEKALAPTEVTLLLLCNPHNPGGRVFSREELTELVRLCERHSVMIFCDEIHSDIVFHPHRHMPLLSIPGAAERAVVAHSIGKTFNTSGLQASFVFAADKALRQAFTSCQDRAHAGGVNLLGKLALRILLSEQGAAYKHQLVRYLHQNTASVCTLMEAVPGVLVMRPEATYLVWMDLRALGSAETVMRRLLQQAKVALSGGRFFGPAGEGWFRFNCAHPRTLLLDAAERVASAARSNR